MIYFSHYLINCLQKHFLLFLTYLLYVFCFCHCNAKPFPLFKSFFRAGASLLPMSSLFARLQEVQPIKHWFILDKTNWENKLPGMYFSAESNYSQKKTLHFQYESRHKAFFQTSTSLDVTEIIFRLTYLFYNCSAKFPFSKIIRRFLIPSSENVILAGQIFECIPSETKRCINLCAWHLKQTPFIASEKKAVH